MNILYQSDFCTVINYVCECTDCAISKPEYQDHFSFCFIRQGNFLFKAFRDDLDSHTGRILINKPGYDYRVAHVHKVPDQCTIFAFTKEAFCQFSDSYLENLNGLLRKVDVQSMLIKSTTTIDFLHARILSLLNSKNDISLELDGLLIELAERVFSADHSEKVFRSIPPKHKEHYLPKIERAKEYIQTNFPDNISLNAIAHECAMSPFHFARIFSRIAEVAPYKYLSDFRFSHARHLLRTSNMSVSEISDLSGYSSPSHFATVFKNRTNTQPSAFRSE